VWQICEPEQDQQKIGANSPFVQRARMENKGVKRRLKSKLSTAAGLVRSCLAPAVLRDFRILMRSVDLASRHQERRINAAVGAPATRQTRQCTLTSVTSQPIPNPTQRQGPSSSSRSSCHSSYSSIDWGRSNEGWVQKSFEDLGRVLLGFP
jgi:hypothetical protein